MFSEELFESCNDLLLSETDIRLSADLARAAAFISWGMLVFDIEMGGKVSWKQKEEKLNLIWTKCNTDTM